LINPIRHFEETLLRAKLGLTPEGDVCRARALILEEAISVVIPDDPTLSGR
jgi:hypothetical protein